MKQTRILSVLLVGIATALTSCSNLPSIKGEALHYNQVNYRSNYKTLRMNGMGYTAENFSTKKGKGGTYNVVSDVKALVVGVDFTDYPASELPKGDEGTLDDLQKAIFGKSEETGWESLKSYYYKSSFGVCKIDGVVADQWYHTNVNVKGFANGDATDGIKNENATQVLCKKVSNWAKDTLNLDMSQFDANKDGFIDSVIMIYSAPPHVQVNGKAVDDDLFWAFCWSRDADEKDANLDDPAPYRFFWASYRTFFEDGYYGNDGQHHDWTDEEIKSGTAPLDAHTLIHEFGHALSLPDYYNGEYTSSSVYAYDPLGCVDMMAWNIGDHNAFSKALYGWISPIVAYGNSTVTLRSTTDKGDFIVIPVEELDDPKKDFTLLSQYIMIEFLTPTGVAYSDSLDAYAGSYPIWFQHPGVRVTLVDARMGMFDYSGKFQGFTGSPLASGGRTRFACDNNDSTRSCYPKYKLIEIIPANGTKAQNLAGNADDTCLYHEGDEFNTTNSKTKWKDFKADGKGGDRDKTFKFGFTIKKLSDKSCTIEIVKK